MRGPHVSFMSILSFPCLRAVARQRAGVEMGIQDMKNWIPAFAGMTSPAWQLPPS
jgi:hypothetical protein